MSLLGKLNFLVEKLIQTSHTIRGAVDSNLDMVSATLAHLEHKKEVARCIIYI